MTPLDGDSGLLDELFPLERHGASRRGRRRVRLDPAEHAPPARRTSTVDGPRTSLGAAGAEERPAPTTPSWTKACLAGLGAAAAGLGARFVVLRVLEGRLAQGGSWRLLELPAAAHLGAGWIAVGALVVALLVALCARRGVPVVVGVAAAVALSTIDLVAPVGIGLVLAAVLLARRR